jgi:pimeloyl-ACP methyl ester carboxylesterase
MSVPSEIRGFATVGDLSIAYESAGIGYPALVFVHGIFQDRSYFAPQFSAFSDRRQVVAVDLRGHGDSSPAAEVTVGDFEADVIAAADEAHLESVVLCGHSMAGVVALKVAAARPQLVRGVVMLDAAVLFPEPVRRLALANLVPALATDRWLDALRGYFSSRILDPHDSPELTARVMAAVGRTRPDFARTFFTSLFASDYADDLENARCPVLHIHAKAPTDLQRLLELRPDAMVVSRACPLFVPFVEEGWFEHPAAELVAKDYLEPLRAAAVDVLVLGCTHYPLLKPLLARVLGPRVRLIDSAEATASAVARELAAHNLAAPDTNRARHEFVVSDDEPHFRSVGERFLGDQLKSVELVQL